MESETHLKDLKEQRQTYPSYEQRMERSGESQIAVTDPDSRLMRDGHKGRDACYNVQFAIDDKHKLIAEYEVTNDVNDQQQLANMSKKVQDSFELDQLTVVADAGYFKKDAVKAKCTSSKDGRRVYRWEHEEIIDCMRKKLSEKKEYMAKRRNICEHPFGTIMHVFGYRNFLCKGSEMVNTEMSITVLAFNMRRVINILGVTQLLTALA